MVSLDGTLGTVGTLNFPHFLAARSNEWARIKPERHDPS